MNDLTPRLRAILARCLPPEDAERCLREWSRELTVANPVRRIIHYRHDAATGRTLTLRRSSPRTPKPG
jgi:hypothetical protein